MKKKPSPKRTRARGPARLRRTAKPKPAVQEKFNIRSILVPASMALLGRMNWYLPAVMGRLLPRLRLEGPRTKPVLPSA